MRKLSIFQVDAFTTRLFGGNPAAVCPLTDWLSHDEMQSIAYENNLSETAFFVLEGEHYKIRWFTPNQEVALCGHATLASAFIIFEKLGHKKDFIIFNSQSGELIVKKKVDILQMDFPALPFTAISSSPVLLDALNVHPLETYESTFDLLFILASEQEVEEANPNLHEISQLSNRGIILSALTAAGKIYSRCFYPGCNVPEDPVTGSAHCVIAPYWCQRLGTTSIHAIQGLKRKGELACQIIKNRVLLSGACQLYLEGHIFIP